MVSTLAHPVSPGEARDLSPALSSWSLQPSPAILVLVVVFAQYFSGDQELTHVIALRESGIALLPLQARDAGVHDETAHQSDRRLLRQIRSLASSSLARKETEVQCRRSLVKHTAWMARDGISLLLPLMSLDSRSDHRCLTFITCSSAPAAWEVMTGNQEVR